MLRLQGGQVESLRDEVLPERLRELPDDLAQIDAFLRDEALLAPVEDALPGACGQDRLDGGGGGRALPDRLRAGGRRGAGPRPRGQAAGCHARWGGGEDQGPLAGGRQAAAGDRAHAAAQDGRGEGGGARADGADGEVARRLGAGGAACGRRGAYEGAGAGPLAEGEGETEGDHDPGERRTPGDAGGAQEKVVEQIRKRLVGEPITDRLVSLFDPDARPIRKGKLGKATEFGYVEQLAEVTPNTKPGARGFIVPPASAPGNPGENELLPTTVEELQRLGLSPREVALDGGFQTKASQEALAPLEPERTFIAGRASPASKRTRRRLARYRVGAEGRISHLKRRHGLRRSRLKGDEGERTWTGWAVFAYNAETYGLYT